MIHRPRQATIYDEMRAAILFRKARNPRRGFHMHRLECVAAIFMQDADQVDDSIGTTNRFTDSIVVARRTGEGHDLADFAHRLERKRLFGVACRYRIIAPVFARRRTRCRPINPVPPKTVIWLILVMA